MKRIITFTIILFSLTGHTQYFSQVKEYRFVNDYNLALTAYKNPGSKLNPIDDKAMGFKALAASNLDSTMLTPLCYTNPDQVWIVEYNPSTCSGTSYFTIRSKSMGLYLTLLGYDETLTTSNMRPANYRIGLAKLKAKGPDDIFSNQKWRFGNLDNLFPLTGSFQPIFPAFWGRTQQVSLKNFFMNFCSVSSFSFDLAYRHLSSNVNVQTQLIGPTMAGDNTKFRIIPNNPVTLVTPKDITFFRCPKVLLKGDREFGGQVVMTLKIDLELNPQRTAIMMKVYFHAEEPKGDRSTTEIAWTEKIYDAPLGLKIKSIPMQTSWTSNFSANLNEESFNQVPCEFLRYCEVVGDTMGDDISTDDNCNDDTRIGNFMFNKLAVIFE